ncbi:ABC transporter permease [Granulicella rosea]|uniref:ABC transporter permease n=1 Tax=Granulicella rosea TaxID=474952 RepID=UPI000B7944E4|nr:ABC transporter permease [Granulicella rosea]
MVNKLIFANLLHRPLRTFLSVLAIGVEVTMILTLVGVSHGTLDATSRRARGVGNDVLIRPPGSIALSLTSAGMSEKLLVKLKDEVPHVTIATGSVVQSLGGLDTLTGVDFTAMNAMAKFKFLAGGPFQQDQDILIDEHYAKQKKLHVGNHLKLVNQDWTVRGVYEEGKLAHILCKVDVLQNLTGNPGKLSQIYLKADNPANAQAIVDKAKELLPGYPIYTMEEFTSLLTASSVGLLDQFVGVVIGVAAIVGFIVVFMAMYTAILERTREIGILKSCGAGPSYILNMLFRETFVIALIGIVFGILLTYGTQWLMQHAVPASLVQETVYYWWPITAAIAIAGAALGTVVPAIKAVRQDATEALSYE